MSDIPTVLPHVAHLLSSVFGGQAFLTYFEVVEVESHCQAVSKRPSENDCQDNLESKLVRQVLEGGRLKKNINIILVKKLIYVTFNHPPVQYTFKIEQFYKAKQLTSNDFNSPGNNQSINTKK